MKKLQFLITMLILALTLGACTPGGPNAEATATDEPTVTLPAAVETAEPMPVANTPVAESGASDCPIATENTHLLRDPSHGFCLLYPVTHKVERPNPQEVVLVVGGLLNAGDPRAMINVSEGRTAAEVADEIVAVFEGFDITPSQTTVAGEPAMVLDNVPGQDINRRVLFTHGDQLYDIYFSPIEPTDTTAIDAFMEGILESFTFIPVSETVTAADECVHPKADQQLITDEAFGYCFVVSSEFTYEQPSETNANIFVGSMMDVEHPKLMIEVIDADGQDAAAAADALAASFEGFAIERTFGDTLGYEPAERLDGVPGQDIGRVLLAVHGDRLYRLTFVPADDTQTELYGQIEALFAQVLNTFRFLP